MGMPTPRRAKNSMAYVVANRAGNLHSTLSTAPLYDTVL